MLSPVIMICGLPLYKYLYFLLLVNAVLLNIVDVVVADPMLPVMDFFVMYF